MIITVYDYANDPVEIEIPAQTYEDILGIQVHILSGDETGIIFMKEGKHRCFDASFVCFDASDMRIRGYDDGSYTVVGTEMIKKWIEYEPKTYGVTISYDRMSDFYEWAYEEREEN